MGRGGELICDADAQLESSAPRRSCVEIGGVL